MHGLYGPPPIALGSTRYFRLTKFGALIRGNGPFTK